MIFPIDWEGYEILGILDADRGMLERVSRHNRTSKSVRR
jgi:hypothetical protein